MARFHYKAANRDGEVIDGKIDAPDRAQAARLLQAQGHIPIQIDDGAGGAAMSQGTSGQHRVKTTAADIDLFTLELATLLRAGLPLDQALGTLTELAENPALAQIAVGVNKAVRSGAPLSEALSQTDPGFDEFFCNMVRAGESSGALDVALERLASFRQNRREMRQALISTLIYPTILLVLALVAVAVLLAFVVPQFTEMFADAGRDLPLLTRIVAGAGDLVVNWWWLMLLVIVGGIWMLRRYLATPEGRARWDTQLLRMPLVGTLTRKLHTARFTRTLGTLLGSGVSLLPAIGIAREIVGNKVMSQALSQVERRVREGEGLATPLSETEVMPTLAVQLVRLGESTGRLEPLLIQVADIYDRDVQTGLKRLLTLAEPVIIITVALLVTAIILSVVLMILESNNLAF